MGFHQVPPRWVSVKKASARAMPTCKLWWPLYFCAWSSHLESCAWKVCGRANRQPIKLHDGMRPTAIEMLVNSCSASENHARVTHSDRSCGQLCSPARPPFFECGCAGCACSVLKSHCGGMSAGDCGSLYLALILSLCRLWAQLSSSRILFGVSSWAAIRQLVQPVVLFSHPPALWSIEQSR